MLEMDKPESPMSSDSAHTPLQDEHLLCDVLIPIEVPVNLEIAETVDMIEEQLDYEEFIENNEETKAESEAEEGEYNSGDDNEVLICEVDDKQSLENGELHSDEDDEPDLTKPIIKSNQKITLESNRVDDAVIIIDDPKCEGELAEGELKAEEEDIIMEETPWERGLRLARERRELAKLKKVQEKDKLKERQLHINLDNMEEVEPICKPQTEANYEINQKLLKAMQPIVILPEEPRHNEMILEYYLAESDYQHRPRFIPSRLYTLDPWEVDEWKRELDMMKMESEMERIATNKHKRGMMGAIKPIKRLGAHRGGSMSSSGSSRSSSMSGNKITSNTSGNFNQSNRTYEFQTSQYALSRSKPTSDKMDKQTISHHHHHNSINKNAASAANTTHLHHRGRRDLPPEFKNRIVSSSRSSSRSSSGSHSSSSGDGGSSSSSRSDCSSPRQPTTARITPKKRAATLANPSGTVTHKSAQQVPTPAFRTIKKPALGRARSDSSASSKSSDDSSSSSTESSSSRSSAASSTNSHKLPSTTARKSNKQTDNKQFINSWFTKSSNNPLLAATIVPSATTTGGVIGTTSNDQIVNDNDNTINVPLDSTDIDHTSNYNNNIDDNVLPSASNRPGVKLKLLSRPKPVILANQSSKTNSSNVKETKKKANPPKTNAAITNSNSDVIQPSSIFNNNKSIFSTTNSTSNSGSHHKNANNNNTSSSQIATIAKESTLKSNLAATQLEMQQEFLRNYKDKIAIYRSQLSYQQQLQQQNALAGGNNCMSGIGQHANTLTHNQPAPIKGPITVMSVTSKKTGPPKTNVKVTDRYSQHEEHSRRYNNNHYSPNNNYRGGDYRDGPSIINTNSNAGFGNRNKRASSRNRSRSFDNNRAGTGEWDKSRGGLGGDYERSTMGGGSRNNNYYDKNSSAYDSKQANRQSDNNYRSRNNEGSNNNNNNRSTFSRNNNNNPYDNNKSFDRNGERNNRYDANDRTRNEFDRSGVANRFDRTDDNRSSRRNDDRNNTRGGARDFNRGAGRDNNNGESFAREDRTRDRHNDREFENSNNKFGGDNYSDKRSNDNPDNKRRRSDDNFDNMATASKSRSHRRDNSIGDNAPSSITASITINHHMDLDIVSSSKNTSSNAPIVAAPNLLPVAVPKEKRREELLKQLKAVEDAIAKKKAKIDK